DVCCPRPLTVFFPWGLAARPGSAIQVMLCLKRAAKTADYPGCCRLALARQHYLDTTTRHFDLSARFTLCRARSEAGGPCHCQTRLYMVVQPFFTPPLLKTPAPEEILNDHSQRSVKARVAGSLGNTCVSGCSSKCCACSARTGYLRAKVCPLSRGEREGGRARGQDTQPAATGFCHRSQRQGGRLDRQGDHPGRPGWRAFSCHAAQPGLERRSAQGPGPVH